MKIKIKKKLIGINATPETLQLLSTLGDFFGYRTRARLVKFLALDAAVRISQIPKPKGMNRKQSYAYKTLKQIIKRYREDVEFRHAVLSIKRPRATLKFEKR